MEVSPPVIPTTDDSSMEDDGENQENMKHVQQETSIETTTLTNNNNNNNNNMNQPLINNNKSSNNESNNANLDDVWEEKSNAKGFTYYVNKETGDTVWEKPNSPAKSEKKQTVWDEWAQNGINQEQPTWEKYYDEVSGHEYYHNPLTMENSWTLPAGAKAVPGVTEADINTHLDQAEHYQYQQKVQNSKNKYMNKKQKKQNNNKSSSRKKKNKNNNRKNWQMLYDKDGTPYYYNSVTGESNWVLDDGNFHNNNNNTNATSGGSSTSSSDSDDASSYDSEVEETFNNVEDEDILDRLKVGAMNITAQASEYVTKMKPHAVDLSNKALGATVAGVSTMWGWIQRVTSEENIKWVQEGSKQMVGNLQDWVDEVVVDPNAGIEHLVERTSKHGEEGVEWMLGNDVDKENSDSDDDDDDSDDNENNLNGMNGKNDDSNSNKKKQKEYKRISFDPSELEQRKMSPSSANVVSVEKEAEKVALEHGNFQAKKLESTLDNLSANILNQKKQKSATSPVS